MTQRTFFFASCLLLGCSSDPATTEDPGDSAITETDGTVSDAAPPDSVLVDTGTDTLVAETSPADVGADAADTSTGDSFLADATDSASAADTAADSAPDAVSDTGPIDAPDAASSPNIVFTTSTTYSANLGGLAGADAKCQSSAAAAGLSGTFRAWLSSTTENARTRIGTARGFVRVDGRPFADTVADLAAGKVLNPLDVTESGALVDSASVRTGTSPGGTLATASTCADWTSATLPDGALGGFTDAGPAAWTLSQSIPCAAPARLYCFQIDKTAPLVYARVAGKRAFVTSGNFDGASSTAGADATCASEAAAAGLVGTFRVLRSTTAFSGASRFSSTSTIVRPDGIVVGTLAQITSDGRLQSGIWQTASGEYGGGVVWTGSTTVGSIGTAATTCGNWSLADGASSAYRGDPARAGARFWFASSIGCLAPERFYCLED